MATHPPRHRHPGRPRGRRRSCRARRRSAAAARPMGRAPMMAPAGKRQGWDWLTWSRHLLEHRRGSMEWDSIDPVDEHRVSSTVFDVRCGCDHHDAGRDHRGARGCPRRRGIPGDDTARGRRSIATDAGSRRGRDVRQLVSTLSDPRACDCSTPSRPHRLGTIRIGDLALELGIGQPTVTTTCRSWPRSGSSNVDRVGTSKHVSVDPACCTGLPHAADVVMGTLAARPCCPEDLPADVTTVR